MPGPAENSEHRLPRWRSTRLGPSPQSQPHHHRMELHTETGPSETPLLNHEDTVLGAPAKQPCLQPLLASVDHIVLDFRRELHKVSAETAYPHYQVLVALRVCFGIEQFLSVQQIVLDMLPALSQECIGKHRKLPSALWTLDSARRELLIQGAR